MAKITKSAGAVKSTAKKTAAADTAVDTKVKATGKKAAAKAAPAKAAKADKVTSEGGRKGRAPAWPLDTKIKVLVENPKRAGSLSFDRFALYGKNATVGEFLAAGGTSGDLHWDSEHEYIKIG